MKVKDQNTSGATKLCVNLPNSTIARLKQHSENSKNSAEALALGLSKLTVTSIVARSVLEYLDKRGEVISTEEKSKALEDILS